MIRAVRQFMWAELAVFSIAIGVMLALINCGPGAEAKSAAEAAYGAELLRCVDKAETRAEAEECRADVETRWGVDSGTR